MTAGVTITIQGAVAVLTICNEPLNLLTRAIRGDIERIARDVGSDDSVRAVVVTAAGSRAFSAGSDIREFPSTQDAGRNRAMHEQACCDALADLPQPVIAALFGHVLGGGLELALACDLRIADTTARLGLPEVKLGVFPSGGGTQRLPQLIRPSTARRMILLGEVVGSAKAAEVGLVDEIVNPGEAASSAIEVAHQIANLPVLAVRAIKKSINTGLAAGVRAGSAVDIELIAGLFESYDAQEGVNAMLQSRKPVFLHR